MGETVSAQIMTLPLILLAFGVLSNVALIANLLILPLVPLAMLLTFLVGVLSGVPILVDMLANLTTWLLSYMTHVADWLAGRSWAQTELSLSGTMAIVVYILIFLAMFYMQRKTKLQLRDVNIVR